MVIILLEFFNFFGFRWDLRLLNLSLKPTSWLSWHKMKTAEWRRMSSWVARKANTNHIKLFGVYAGVFFLKRPRPSGFWCPHGFLVKNPNKTRKPSQSLHTRTVIYGFFNSRFCCSLRFAKTGMLGASDDGWLTWLWRWVKARTWHREEQKNLLKQTKLYRLVFSSQKIATLPT